MNTYSNKDPQEVVPLAWDFAPLLATGETILSASWTVTDPAEYSADFANMLPDGVAIDGTVVKQRIANGTNGVCYRYRVEITTSNDNTFVETPTQLVMKA